MPDAEAALSAAIGQGQFQLMFQPMLAPHSRRVAGVEALVRWQHPRRGLLEPTAFVPAMERAGQLSALTDWVITRAAETCMAWRDAGMTVPVSVNLSATLLHDIQLADRVLAQLDLVGMPADLLTLEVTETALAQSGHDAARILGDLRRIGIGISIDDFGTGYTSLAMLKDYTFDEVKIDRSFVAPLLHSPVDAAIVRSILELGHRLGLTVVAEGIEDEATARLLEELGCDMLQGFHFAKSGTAEETLQIIQARGTAAGRVLSEPVGFGRPRSSESARPLRPVGMTSGDSVGADRAAARNATAARGLPATELPATDRWQVCQDSGLAASTVLHVGTDPDQVLDDLVQIAAAICNTPTVSLSFLRCDRQWFKTRLGITMGEGPRDVSSGEHAIGRPRGMPEVPDARPAMQFAANPPITVDPAPGFCAVAQLITADGFIAGTLCVPDAVAHTLSKTQRGALDKLARLALNYLQISRTEVFLQSLQHVSHALSRMHAKEGAPDVASVVTSGARKILRFDGAAVFLHEEPGSVVFRAAGVVADSPADAVAMAAMAIDSRADLAVAAVIRTRRPLFVADTHHSELPDSELATVIHFASSLCLPLRNEATVVGVLAMWWKTPQETPLPAAMTALSMVADEAGRALSRLDELTTLRASADTDPLTGLLNRSAFTANLKGLPAASVLVMIGLDDFERINDKYGYQAGDQALKSFAAHLRAAVRAGDLVARWGGEEFALAVLGGAADGARSILDRLRQSWSGDPTTFSVGITVPGPTESGAAAIQRAVTVLHTAKRVGPDPENDAPATIGRQARNGVEWGADR